MPRLLLLLALPACLPYGLGGEETDGYTDGDPAVVGDSSPGMESGTLVAVDFSATPATREDEPLGLTAVGRTGAIDLAHVLDLPCGTSITGANGALDEDAATLTVAYDAVTADTASADCRFRLVYTFEDVPAGDWEVRAEDDRASCTVKP